MSDVVSLKDRAEKQKEEAKEETGDGYFAEMQKKNREKEERMRKEREKANKGVIRSYRLKH